MLYSKKRGEEIGYYCLKLVYLGFSMLEREEKRK
jgi:hypothetical protein